MELRAHPLPLKLRLPVSGVSATPPYLGGGGHSHSAPYSQLGPTPHTPPPPAPPCLSSATSPRRSLAPGSAAPPLFGPAPYRGTPPPYRGGGLPAGQRYPNIGSECGWRPGWQVRGGRAADPAGGPRAPRRGRCCRLPPGGPVPRLPSCARPGVGCSAEAAGSAGGWRGRHPEGHPAWGVIEDVGRGLPSRQPGLGTSPLPSLSRSPPHNYDNPMVLGKWKGALQRCRVIIYYHTRESREGKGLSRDHLAKKDKART